jgi:diguanylate cyclase (GGDEF)-like protein/PAS domain S-box-containing protein
MIRQNVALADNGRLVKRLDASVENVGRQERRLRSLLQHASDITMLINGERAVTYVSPAIERILGHPPAAAVGRLAVDVLQPADRPNLERLLTQLTVDRSATITTHLQARHGDGSSRWLELVATSRLDDPSVSGVIINIRDITEAIQLQDRLRYEASHDKLTGLANRALLDERAEGYVEDPARQSKSKAVLMLDLDDFKAVNDILGHHIGDQLLIVVAARLRNCVRPADTVARLGGDEFTVFLTGTSQRDAVGTADRILTALSEPVSLENHTLSAPASIGIAVSHTKPFEALLREADTAMYEAKRAHSGTHLYADDES